MAGSGDFSKPCSFPAPQLGGSADFVPLGDVFAETYLIKKRPIVAVKSHESTPARDRLVMKFGLREEIPVGKDVRLLMFRLGGQVVRIQLSVSS